jgi:hypothetical protein
MSPHGKQLGSNAPLEQNPGNNIRQKVGGHGSQLNKSREEDMEIDQQNSE